MRGKERIGLLNEEAQFLTDLFTHIGRVEKSEKAISGFIFDTTGLTLTTKAGDSIEEIRDAIEIRFADLQKKIKDAEGE